MICLLAWLLFAHPVPRMAKTFDNISEAASTNYLFLFAQRTLALLHEPPTPPPLNALGLPCEAICRLWAWRYPEKANEYLSSYLKSIGAARTVVADTAVADTVEEKAAEGGPKAREGPATLRPGVTLTLT